MGAGKTTVGKILAEKLEYKFFDSDKLIESNAGASINWIFDVEGESGFRKRETYVIEELTSQTTVVVATGGGSILSPHNRALLTSRGIVIYLKVSLEQQLARIGQAKDRPLLLKEDTVQKSIIKLCKERDPIYTEMANYIVATDDTSPKSVADDILINLQDLICKKTQ